MLFSALAPPHPPPKKKTQHKEQQNQNKSWKCKSMTFLIGQTSDLKKLLGTNHLEGIQGIIDFQQGFMKNKLEQTNFDEQAWWVAVNVGCLDTCETFDVVPFNKHVSELRECNLGKKLKKEACITGWIFRLIVNV